MFDSTNSTNSKNKTDTHARSESASSSRSNIVAIRVIMQFEGTRAWGRGLLRYVLRFRARQFRLVRVCAPTVRI